jgi:uncharacterized protein (DUF305 family)
VTPVTQTFVATIVIDRAFLNTSFHLEMSMTRRRLWTVAGVAFVLLATVGAVAAARSGGDRSASAARPSASAPAVPVIVPGKPGESAGVTGSGSFRPPGPDTYNTVDTAFMQMMIAHHQQALRMAELAPSRAGNTQLRSFAERINVAQKVEIGVLEAWLKDRGLPASDPAHDHATMPGMQTEPAITALAAAKGAEFDRRFVTMMIAHHEGARQMAGTVLQGGADQRANEIANEMAVEQASEIRRMRDLNVT